MTRLGLVLLTVAACEHGKGGGIPPGTDGGGAVCGGFAGTPCAADEWCDFATNDCGGSDNTGTCRTRPIACDDNLDPVCGCDGQTYGNACEAAKAVTHNIAAASPLDMTVGAAPVFLDVPPDADPSLQVEIAPVSGIDWRRFLP